MAGLFWEFIELAPYIIAYCSCFVHSLADDGADTLQCLQEVCGEGRFRTGGCGAVYHTAYATERLGYVSLDSRDRIPFHCDSCTMHRSSVTPRTPEGDHSCSASRGSSSSSTVTLDDVMQQLKQSGEVMQQLRQSGGVVNVRLALSRSH